MKIIWDERKRLANVSKHGMDFADIDIEFFAEATILPARDNRLMAIGSIEDFAITVIFNRLGTEAISIVSMRPASEKERKAR